MQQLGTTFKQLPESVMVNDLLDQGLMALMSRQPLSAETFYLTGYETLTFNRNLDFALETVLSSVVPFEKELLIISNDDTNLKIIDLCEKQLVNYKIVSIPTNKDGWDNLEKVLTNYRQFSHVLVSGDVSSDCERSHLLQLGSYLENSRIGFILHCNHQPMILSDVRAVGIDYMICNGLGCAVSSVVLAKRSRLVQTEGISRNSMFDLHGYWQKTLHRRKSGIEPMAV